MTSNLVLALTIGALFACGIYLMLSRNLIRVLLGFLLAGHAVNLLLLASGTGGVPPIVGQAKDGEAMADPIPHALILTSIVIGLAVSTFLLAMAYRNYQVTKEPEIPEELEDSEYAGSDPSGGDE